MSSHRPITLAPLVAPDPHDHARKLINAAFCGKVGPADMVYMARALLQLSDELAEMKERVRALELVAKNLDRNA